MIILLVSPIFAILNALRGGGHINRLSCVAGMTITVFLMRLYQNFSIEESLFTFVIIFTGLYIGLICGWGKYLNILSGNMKYVNEIEVKPIDWITTKICKFPTNPNEFIRWCFVAFTFRGLMFYPLFIMLAFYNVNSLIYGLGCSFMGCIYYVARIAPVGHQVRSAEFIYGGLLGLLISFSV